MVIKCFACGKDFNIKPSWSGKRKCCSKKCHGKYLSKKYKGRKISETWRDNISRAKLGDKHPLWKGENVGYKSLHQWLKRRLGIADICENCGSGRNVEWASKSHNYSRDLNDWIKLCKSCHVRYDYPPAWGMASKLYKNGVGGLGVKL